MNNENDKGLTEAAGIMSDTGEAASDSENKKTLKSKSKKRPGKKMPKWATALIVIGCFALTGIIIAGIMNAMKGMQTAMQDAAEQMSGNDIYTVEKTDVEQEIATSGTTIGLEEDAYTSPVTAKVDDIRVEVGQTIHKGEVLLTYDTSELGENLAKVKIQARSEAAASNESIEAADKASDKADAATSKAKKLKKEVKSLKKEVESISDQITAAEDELADIQSKNAKIEAENAAAKEAALETGEAVTEQPLLDTKEAQNKIRELNKQLAKKNDSLTNKQTSLAEQQSIASTNKDVEVSNSTKAQISAAKEISDMNVSDAQEAYDEGVAGVVAESDGIISSIQVVKGAYANETQTLFTIIDADKLGVSFTISKDDLGSVQPNQKVRIVIGNNQYDGFVRYISRVASTDSAYAATGNSSGGNIEGKIVVNNPDENLYIGVSAKVYIFVGRSEDTLAVPYEALNTDIDGDYVYVVDENNKIQRKDVKIGIFSDEYYEITEGIEEGDKVIREVTKNMKPGDEYVSETPAMPGLMGQ